MSRWGEEEKKSKGIVGCLIAFLILFVFSYTFYINYQNLEDRRILEKKLNEYGNQGYNLSAQEIKARLLDFIEEREMEISEDDVEIIKGMDDYGNHTIGGRIEFRFTVNLLIMDYPVEIPIIMEEHPIVVL